MGEGGGDVDREGEEGRVKERERFGGGEGVQMEPSKREIGLRTRKGSL